MVSFGKTAFKKFTSSQEQAYVLQSREITTERWTAPPKRHVWEPVSAEVRQIWKV